MKFLTSLSVLCIYCLTTLAQKSVESGYILDHNRDTLKGYIEVAMEAELSQSVKFKKDDHSALKEFLPSEIMGFGIGKQVYRSLAFVNTVDKMKVNAFVQQLVSGDYNLYSYTTADRKFYLLQKDTNQFFIYDRVSTNRGEIDQEGNYQNYLHFISVNCTKISNLYDRVSYNDQDLTAFVLKVDNCDEKGTATSFYEKPKTQMQPFIFVGGLPVSNMNQFTANFYMRFTTPRVDKKTSVNVGLYYSYNTVESSERSDYYSLYTLITHNQVFSIPVTFQYNFTSTVVQPYFYAGFSGAYHSQTANSYTTGIPSTDSHFGIALVLGIGIEAKVASRLYIKADWRYEVIMQYPAIGLAYQF